MICLEGVSKSFDGGSSLAVSEVDLEVATGEIVVLLGESGCGKTTTLKMINRLVAPTAGVISVDGRDTAEVDEVELRRSIGWAIQGVGLFPHMTVAENVAVVPTLCGWEEQRTHRRVDELLDLVRLDPAEFSDRSPAQLSGGQAQRVGLARALAAQPSIMLMDEPFGALDPLTRQIVQEEYRAIHDELGLTTVLVTHDVTEALSLADRVAVMRAGRLVCVGTPSELLKSAPDPYVNELLAMPRRQAERVFGLA